MNYWRIIIGMAILLTSCQTKETNAPQPSKGKYDDFIRNPRTATGPVDSSMLPIITFKDKVIDFGSIKEGEVIRRTFEYTNTGKSALIVSSATSSCGCTVPDIDKTPLPPGESSSIEVKFNSENREGLQDKTIVIYANTLPGDHRLRLKGNVETKE